MKTGVSIVPWAVWRRPARARVWEHSATTSNVGLKRRLWHGGAAADSCSGFRVTLPPIGARRRYTPALATSDLLRISIGELESLLECDRWRGPHPEAVTGRPSGASSVLC